MRKWLILVLTVAWLAWELVAAFDGNPATWPLTQVVVTYVPAWITLPAALLLAVWLPWHFWSNYRAKRTVPRESLMSDPTTVPAAVTPLPVPAPANLDARTRALRTAAQGLLVDVTSTVALVAVTQLSDLRWTRAYWLALGLMLGKTAVTAAASYIARTVVPPKTS